MPKYVSDSVITKLDKPVLTYKDTGVNSALVYNSGVIKYNGQYVMMFRHDYGDFENQVLENASLGLAVSDNGIDWEIKSMDCFNLSHIVDDTTKNEFKKVYDPRLTVIDGEVYICFALDIKHGLCGGIAKTTDFEHYEFLSHSLPDNRNMVLFPEKIGGKYARLERPMPVYSRWGKDRFDMWFSDSPDLKYWGNHKLVAGVEDIPFADDKIGPAAPPVKTDKGWLTTFHAVERDFTRGKNGWEDQWQKSYYGGIMLLDLEDPSKVIGMSDKPLICCDRDFELFNGFRKDVVFPGGMILEDSGEVKIYYGASDTHQCLATADVNDLLGLCLK